MLVYDKELIPYAFTKKWSLSKNFWLIRYIHRNNDAQPGAQPRRSQKHATDFLKDIKKPHMKFHYPVFKKKKKAEHGLVLLL